MTKKLRDCPHYHAKQEDVVPHPDGHGTTPSLTVEVWNRPYPRVVAYVLCNKCGARGPEKETADAAKGAWGYK